MLKNKIIRRIALLASVIMLFTSTVQTTFGFIVTKTETLVNTFKPFESILSDLLITKTVEHSFGETYVIPDNISFDFKVSFGKLYANTVIKTTVGEKLSDETGSIMVSLGAGKTLGIEGIDAGTKVTVTELLKEGNGFAVKDGTISKEAVISENGSITMDFVNVYTPKKVEPVNLTVSGTKLLEGREWQKGDTFSFLLEQNISGEWVDLGTKTIAYSGENKNFNSFNFNDLIQSVSFDKVGNYDFRITEINGKLDSLNYDKTVNSFTVKVTDTDMDGRLEIGNVSAAQNAAVTQENGNYNIFVTFNNKFIPSVVPDDIAIDITVNKTVKNMGAESIGPDGFEFVLEDTVSGEKIALKSDKNGKAVFNIPFTAADIGKTYSYKLYETDGGKQGVTYDDDVYDISVAIAQGSDNKLEAVITMNGETVESCKADFINVYYKESSAPTTGDNSNVAFWIVMMIISGMACVALLVLEKKSSLKTK